MQEDDDGKPVVIPDILAEFYRFDHWNWQHLPWPGAMSDQPWQLMFELECVAEVLALQAKLDKANGDNAGKN